MGDKQSTVDVALVRTRDVRHLREWGPPQGERLPSSHGSDGDPRYPSPRALRNVLAFTVDFLLHVLLAFGVTAAFLHSPRLSGLWAVGAIGGFLLCSIGHRIFVQRLTGASLGKALTGLRFVREDTGGRPTVWQLTRNWLVGVFVVAATVLSGF
ncbi:putative RDD family membrane protein YckC [Kutzneria viridogrisea]|uniref:RDD family membrane protein YckC n=1 Tax=Kutzneria viridogrisea TaxID=47990 RepID=A0ABR6BJ98_9PSEU|nr:RDD family protein [Kutzneria albida]MBA8926957.1 putative RDD family membrane protein YckC [Kutzneria viridogrisea]